MMFSAEELGLGVGLGVDERYHVRANWVSKLLSNLPFFTTKGKLRECIASDKFEPEYEHFNSDPLTQYGINHWATTLPYIISILYN